MLHFEVDMGADVHEDETGDGEEEMDQYGDAEQINVVIGALQPGQIGH